MWPAAPGLQLWESLSRRSHDISTQKYELWLAVALKLLCMFTCGVNYHRDKMGGRNEKKLSHRGTFSNSLSNA